MFLTNSFATSSLTTKFMLTISFSKLVAAVNIADQILRNGLNNLLLDDDLRRPIHLIRNLTLVHHHRLLRMHHHLLLLWCHHRLLWQHSRLTRLHVHHLLVWHHRSLTCRRSHYHRLSHHWLLLLIDRIPHQMFLFISFLHRYYSIIYIIVMMQTFCYT